MNEAHHQQHLLKTPKSLHVDLVEHAKSPLRCKSYRSDVASEKACPDLMTKVWLFIVAIILNLSDTLVDRSIRCW